MPCYSQSDLNLAYQSDVKKALGIKNVKVGLDFNNVFARHYAMMAYDFGEYVDGKRGNWFSYIPAAGFNVMAHLTLKF